jgi:hypothetical protein
MNSNLPYLCIFTPAPSLELLHSIDFGKGKIRNVEEIIDDVKYFKAIGIRSNYKNPFKAEFKRNDENSYDPLSSRAIKSYDRPIRYSNQELLDLLEPYKQRGRDRKKRKIHQNSLNNLRKAPNWAADSRPSKPKRITEEIIKQAIALKQTGMSWRKIGDKLETNFQSIRTAINRQSLKSNSQTVNITFFENEITKSISYN